MSSQYKLDQYVNVSGNSNLSSFLPGKKGTPTWGGGGGLLIRAPVELPKPEVGIRAQILSKGHWRASISSTLSKVYLPLVFLLPALRP
jgi:hypothetical protein